MEASTSRAIAEVSEEDYSDLAAGEDQLDLASKFANLRVSMRWRHR